MVEPLLHADCGCDAQPADLARARREIRVAIAMVAGGAARTVRIANLPDAEHAAAEGVAAAQAAGVALRLLRDGPPDRPAVVVGPLLDG